MLAQVYWLYTRGEFNKTYLLSGFLITEVDEPIHAIEQHREAEVSVNVTNIQHCGHLRLIVFDEHKTEIVFVQDSGAD